MMDMLNLHWIEEEDFLREVVRLETSPEYISDLKGLLKLDFAKKVAGNMIKRDFDRSFPDVLMVAA